MRSILIDPEIFSLFPSFVRGAIIVSRMENLEKNEDIRALLHDMIEYRRGTPSRDDELVRTWDDAHRQFGSNPNAYPPSIKALLKRIEKGGPFPFVNSAVALFNYISLKYLLPCGGDDVERISGNLRLGLAKGNEKFIPLGSDAEENPPAGEVIYYDDQTLNVMCRRWNWRNGDFTKITPQATKVVINLDGLAPASRETIMEAQTELAELLRRHCGAEFTSVLLEVNRRKIALPL